MRVAIVGSSGSGKTTLAKAVAERTGATHLEIDAFFHRPNWTAAPRDEFRGELASAMDDADAWVTDGNYNSMVGDLIQQRADTVVFFDLPRWLVMRRLIWRTVRRAISREELWNGNREPLTNFYRWDPDKNVIRWSWVHHKQNAERYRAALTDDSWAHADIIHVQRQVDADRWLAALSGTQ